MSTSSSHETKLLDMVNNKLPEPEQNLKDALDKLEKSFLIFRPVEKRTSLIDVDMIHAMEDVLEIGIEERKQKKNDDEFQHVPNEETNWRISDVTMGLITHILRNLFVNNPNHVKAVFPRRLVSLLIGVAEECEKDTRKFALYSLRRIIDGALIEQIIEMIKMNIFHRLLALLKYSSHSFSYYSATCIADILNRISTPLLVEDTTELPFEPEKEKMPRSTVKDVMEWLRKEEKGKGWVELVRDIVQFGNQGTIEIMMSEGFGDVVNEILIDVKRKGTDESGTCARVLSRLWQSRMRTNDEEEKKKQKKLIQVMVEEEGEEAGIMDGVVGIINNPFVKEGFGDFYETVFGGKDIAQWRHSLKKLLLFLG